MNISSKSLVKGNDAVVLRGVINIDQSIRGSLKPVVMPRSLNDTDDTFIDGEDIAPSLDPLDTISKRPSLTSVGSSFRSAVTKPWHNVEVDRARHHVGKLFKDSVLEDRTGLFPKFTQDECSLGKYLGKGSFGTVHEIKKFVIPQGVADKNVSTDLIDDDSLDDNEIEGREFIAKHCTRETGEARYAIKCLNEEIIEDRSLYSQGVANMVIEARMLSAVEHPNIIKLRALAACDMYQQPGFFLIMDRLYDTLDNRLIKWQLRQRRTAGLFSVLDRKGKKKTSLLEERLVAAFDLSAALEFLHMQGILHRDLKPENIGFDIRGDIKLFDFSLATELRSKVRNEDGTYNLTGMTGSLRYMAPEVAQEKPYNASCDVYSFAVMFWEMYALKKPFALLTSNVFMKFVINGDTRPPVPDNWPMPLKILLKRCWSKNLNERLSMREVSSILKKEITCVRGGDDRGLEHTRRRSTFVYRKPSGPPVTKLPSRSVSA